MCLQIKFLLHTLSQSALGWDYQADLAKHASQTDASKGFGGKYGVQKNLKDKVCVIVVAINMDKCAPRSK